ncbi:hypothetical protein [Desulfococcus sp.]|uniref:hypothetical protein n=1 Tax=Desulfococcus sp. TaxID=2025834 RepID=UPI003593496A
MYSRKIALAHARQIRRCPPLSLLRDPDRPAELDLHLAICPHCTDALHEGEAMELLAKKLGAEKAPADDAKGLDVAAGQIRTVRPEKAGWHQGYHYNPPTVIVLDVRKKISDDIRVAQIYEDTILAAPGDLILEDEHTGAGELFVECWNTYTLKAAYLGAVAGQAAPPVIDAVLRLEEDPDDAPIWAPLPFPLREDDPRIHFRELEVETAFFFSSQAAGELMAELEKRSIRTVYASPAELSRVIGEKVPGIRFSLEPDSFEDALAAPEFPPYSLPLAAAADREKTIIAKHVMFKDGHLTVYAPMEVDVFSAHAMEGGRVGFSGRFPVQPETRPVHLIFRYAGPDGVLIEPAAHPHWDAETGSFSVVFDTSTKDWRKLRLAVLYEGVQAS